MQQRLLMVQRDEKIGLGFGSNFVNDVYWRLLKYCLGDVQHTLDVQYHRTTYSSSRFLIINEDAELIECSINVPFPVSTSVS